MPRSKAMQVFMTSCLFVPKGCKNCPESPYADIFDSFPLAYLKTRYFYQP